MMISDYCYEISEEESKEINVLRAIFTVMVVFIHTYNYLGKGEMNMAGGGIVIELPAQVSFLMDLFSVRISGIANSGFFFLAGLFLFRKNFTFWKNLKKKFRTLAIPAILVTTYWVGIYLLGESISFTNQFFANPDRIISQWEPIQWLNAYFAISSGSHMLVYPLWFAKELFLLNILAYPIKCLMDKKPILMAIILLVLKFAGGQIPIVGGVIGKVIPLNVWFFAAYYIIYFNVHLKILKIIRIWGITLLYGATLFLTYIPIPSDSNIIIGYISDIVSFVFWYRMAVVILNMAPAKINKIFSVVAKYSFLIYIMHELNLRMVQKIAFRLMPLSVLSFVIQYLLCPIFIIYMIVMFSMFLQKRIPIVYRVLSGGRA